jgi:hypothetical protein
MKEKKKGEFVGVGDAGVEKFSILEQIDLTMCDQ